MRIIRTAILSYSASVATNWSVIAKSTCLDDRDNGAPTRHRSSTAVVPKGRGGTGEYTVMMREIVCGTPVAGETRHVVVEYGLRYLLSVGERVPMLSALLLSMARSPSAQ